MNERLVRDNEKEAETMGLPTHELLAFAFMLILGETLGENVGKLIRRVDVPEFDLAGLELGAEPVVLGRDVASARSESRWVVGGKLHGGLVVFMHERHSAWTVGFETKSSLDVLEDSAKMHKRSHGS